MKNAYRLFFTSKSVSLSLAQLELIARVDSTARPKSLHGSFVGAANSSTNNSINPNSLKNHNGENAFDVVECFMDNKEAFENGLVDFVTNRPVFWLQ